MILPSGALSASVQALTLAKGLHLVCVTAASPQRMGDEAELTLPAIHVGVGPGAQPDQVEMLPGPRNSGQWLVEARDMLVIKVVSGQAVILLTTVKAPGQGSIAVEVTRLDGKASAATAPIARTPALPSSRAPEGAGRLAVASPAVPPGIKTPSGRLSLSTRIDLHISRKGDAAYVNNYWAGALGERLAIEGFAISPLEGLGPHQLEYSAVAATGGETGWIEGGRLCGTRGAGAALAGFALRLKPAAAADYECEYRGSFSSGRIVGPVRDGGLCISDQGDRLEAIQVFILPREPGVDAPLMIAGSPAAEDPAPSPPAALSLAQQSSARPVGPRFSVFRETVE